MQVGAGGVIRVTPGSNGKPYARRHHRLAGEVKHQTNRPCQPRQPDQHPTWLAAVLVQDDHVCKVVAAARLDQLAQQHAAPGQAEAAGWRLGVWDRDVRREPAAYRHTRRRWQNND